MQLNKKTRNKINYLKVSYLFVESVGFYNFINIVEISQKQKIYI